MDSTCRTPARRDRGLEWRWSQVGSRMSAAAGAGQPRREPASALWARLQPRCVIAVTSPACGRGRAEGAGEGRAERSHSHDSRRGDARRRATRVRLKEANTPRCPFLRSTDAKTRVAALQRLPARESNAMRVSPDRKQVLSAMKHERPAFGQQKPATDQEKPVVDPVGGGHHGVDASKPSTKSASDTSRVAYSADT